MGIQQQIAQATGMNRNAGIARIQRNRIARQMVSRLRAANPGARNIGATL